MGSNPGGVGLPYLKVGLIISLMVLDISNIRAGKTRTHYGSNIADMIMFLKCCLFFAMLTTFVVDTNFVCWTPKLFLINFRTFFVPVQHVFPQTGNIAGHNVTATQCYCQHNVTANTMLLPQCVLVFPGPWQVTLCARWFLSGLVQFLHLQQQPSVLALFQSETLVSSHWSMKLLQDVSRNVLLVVCPADLITGSANETKAFTNPGLYPVHTNA